MSSVRHPNFNRALVLSLLMMMMTQVGYLESMNPWTNGEETLDETNDVLETGGSGGATQSNFTASIEGADLIIDEAMTNITFQYDADAVHGSGSGSYTETYNGNGTAWLVKDIVSGSGDSLPIEFGALGDTLLFSANDGTHGYELWKSDGTSTGTVMLKDIYSGSANAYPSQGIYIGNTSYFTAIDATHGRELWKTDGTAAGTVMVKDINSASGTSFISELTAVGNTLYFIANDGTNGMELWKSDGTAAGTVMVKDISGSSSNPSFLTAVGNTLFFRANDGTHGHELWKSDGTASGTVMVKDINNGSIGNYATDFTAVGSTLYFQADDGTHGGELWKSDGTTAGTVMVKDITNGSGSNQFHVAAAVGNTLYFQANDDIHGQELWKSDGTTSGTVMVKDINNGSSHGLRINEALQVMGNTLYFIGNDGTNGHELWKSDGTASGTVMVKDISSGSGSSNAGGTSPHFTVIGNTLYFAARDGGNAINYGRELWKTDGTASGTVVAADIVSGIFGSDPGGNYGKTVKFVGNTLYFTANYYDNSQVDLGVELWALDPADVTGLYTSFTNVTGATCTVSPSLPAGLSIDSSTCTISGTPTAETSNTTYTVTANISNVTHQTIVWLSTSNLELTPSAEGADLIIDEAMTNITFQYNASAASGSGSGSNSGIYNGNGTAWLVKDINSISASSVAHLTAVGNTLYFRADDGTNGYELWKSDGTAVGTVMVKDIRSGSSSGSPNYLTAVGTTLYFVANDGTN